MSDEIMDDDVFELRRFKEQKLRLLQKKLQLKRDLPHIYGWPWYEWAWEFYNNTTDKTQLLCAANQISKSSTQIRKCINWATNQELWPELWGRKPNQFWYLYPSKEVATAEFETKWIPEFLPRGEMKDDPLYGWSAQYDKKHIVSIKFNSGVVVYFKTYAQDAQRLQSGSVYSIFCDEELPEHLYDELKFRTAGTNGYFHMVFTATLGQMIWWQAMEAIGTDQELFKRAWKKQISMYDCLKYNDGRPSPWTEERIQQVIDDCKSKAEVLRRVYGRFVKEEGRTYHAFDITRHFVKPFKLPDHCMKFAAVDIGSGGEKGHPTAIVFVAILPDGKKGYVYDAWRGDGIPTTAGDAFNKYVEMAQGQIMTREIYDWASADFGTIATRLGRSFVKAEKNHELGENIINTLLKYDMLQFFDKEEVRKIGTEMLNLQKSTAKKDAKDDLCDAVRYACVSAPWDFTDIDEYREQPTPKSTEPPTKEELVEREIEERRKGFFDKKGNREDDKWGIQQEFDYWNKEYGN